MNNTHWGSPNNANNANNSGISRAPGNSRTNSTNSSNNYYSALLSSSAAPSSSYLPYSSSLSNHLNSNTTTANSNLSSLIAAAGRTPVSSSSPPDHNAFLPLGFSAYNQQYQQLASSNPLLHSHTNILHNDNNSYLASTHQNNNSSTTTSMNINQLHSNDRKNNQENYDNHDHHHENLQSYINGAAGAVPSKKKRKPKDKNKPSRPLSAYNIFFKDERKKILSSISGGNDDDDDDDNHGNGDGDDQDESKRKTKKQKISMVKDKEDNVMDEKNPTHDSVCQKNNSHDDEDVHDTNISSSDSKNNDTNNNVTAKPQNDDENSTADNNNKNNNNNTKTKKNRDDDKSKKTPHGKISFESLAKIIAASWKTIDPERLKYYKAKSAIDHERYAKEMEEYEANKLLQQNETTNTTNATTPTPEVRQRSESDSTAAANMLALQSTSDPDAPRATVTNAHAANFYSGIDLSSNSLFMQRPATFSAIQEKKRMKMISEEYLRQKALSSNTDRNLKSSPHPHSASSLSNNMMNPSLTPMDSNANRINNYNPSFDLLQNNNRILNNMSSLNDSQQPHTAHLSNPTQSMEDFNVATNNNTGIYNNAPMMANNANHRFLGELYNSNLELLNLLNNYRMPSRSTSQVSNPDPTPNNIMNLLQQQRQQYTDYPPQLSDMSTPTIATITSNSNGGDMSINPLGNDLLQYDVNDRSVSQLLLQMDPSLFTDFSPQVSRLSFSGGIHPNPTIPYTVNSPQVSNANRDDFYNALRQMSFGQIDGLRQMSLGQIDYSDLVRQASILSSSNPLNLTNNNINNNQLQNNQNTTNPSGLNSQHSTTPHSSNLQQYTAPDRVGSKNDVSNATGSSTNDL